MTTSLFFKITDGIHTHRLDLWNQRFVSFRQLILIILLPTLLIPIISHHHHCHRPLFLLVSTQNSKLPFHKSFPPLTLPLIRLPSRTYDCSIVLFVFPIIFINFGTCDTVVFDRTLNICTLMIWRLVINIIIKHVNRSRWCHLSCSAVDWDDIQCACLSAFIL